MHLRLWCWARQAHEGRAAVGWALVSLQEAVRASGGVCVSFSDPSPQFPRCVKGGGDIRALVPGIQ